MHSLSFQTEHYQKLHHALPQSSAATALLGTERMSKSGFACHGNGIGRLLIGMERLSKSGTERLGKSGVACHGISSRISGGIFLSLDAPRSGFAILQLLLYLPFRENKEAKAMGARWDAKAKKWYAPSTAVQKKLTTRWTCCT